MELLLKSAAECTEILRTAVEEIVDLFQDDLQFNELCTKLSLLKNVMASIEFTYTNLKQKVCEYQAILPQVTKLMQLLLATSAISERSFFSTSSCKELFANYNESRSFELPHTFIHT